MGCHEKIQTVGTEFKYVESDDKRAQKLRTSICQKCMSSEERLYVGDLIRSEDGTMREITGEKLGIQNYYKMDSNSRWIKGRGTGLPEGFRVICGMCHQIPDFHDAIQWEKNGQEKSTMVCFRCSSARPKCNSCGKNRKVAGARMGVDRRLLVDWATTCWHCGPPEPEEILSKIPWPLEILEPKDNSWMSLVFKPSILGASVMTLACMFRIFCC